MPGHQEDIQGHQKDIPGHQEDIPGTPYRQVQPLPAERKKPSRRPVCFSERASPWGDGRGELPPAVSFQVDRSPPYNAAGGGRGYGPCLLPVARQGADGGDPGKSRAAPGAVHFTLDFPGRGTDLSRSFQARYFLYFRPVRSSPFSSWNFLSGEFLYSPSISLR